MQCFVYRSPKKADTYLFIAQKDEFSRIPEALMKVFGIPEFAMEFELTPNRKLAAADPNEVIEFISQQGFYLQIPTENKYPI